MKFKAEIKVNFPKAWRKVNRSQTIQKKLKEWKCRDQAKRQRNLGKQRVILRIELKSQKPNNSISWTEGNQKAICLLPWTKVELLTVVAVVAVVVNLSLLQGKTPDDTRLIYDLKAERDSFLHVTSPYYFLQDTAAGHEIGP